MRILSIYRINNSNPSNAGVIQKQNAQVAAMRLHHEVDQIYLSADGIYKNGEQIFKIDPVVFKSRRKLFKFYHFQYYRILDVLLKPETYDLIYLRFHVMHSSFYSFLENSKTTENKIILEIPTYPYEAEYKGILQKLRIRVDRVYRDKIAPFVDCIVHYGPHEEIFGIPTISITNGLDTSLAYKQAAKNKDDILRLVAIGKWQPWHGLDRLLNGITNYQGNEKIELKVIGDGPELENYKRYVKKNQLEQIVNFYSGTTGDELDVLMDGADIGIGSLGDHRKSLSESSPLKNREYCMRGIPFILSSPDPDFPKELPFVFYATVNDDAIDIKDLMKFKNKFSVGQSESMVTYGKEKLGWDLRMEKIFATLSQ